MSYAALWPGRYEQAFASVFQNLQGDYKPRRGALGEPTDDYVCDQPVLYAMLNPRLKNLRTVGLLQDGGDQCCDQGFRQDEGDAFRIDLRDDDMIWSERRLLGGGREREGDDGD